MKKTLKKSLLTILAVITMTVVFCFGASALDSTGICGENVRWKFNSSTGELVISGTGAMTDYGNRVSPFKNDLTIKKVVISNGVTSIGSCAFEMCNITNITIPDSVTHIGEKAFYSCELISIVIPDSVISIGNEAFSGFNALYSIRVDENNKYYSHDEYGVLFNKDKTELIQYPMKNMRTSYIIPDSVVTIGNGAFYNSDYLYSVTIGDSVTTIGNSAFAWCIGLFDITIPDSVITIGEEAFYFCEKLTKATIGDGVTTIGDYAFRGCDELSIVAIGNRVTSIGRYSFWECTNLKDLTIGNSVINIGQSAFSDCTNLASVTIPGSVRTIDRYAFRNCVSLTSIAIPDGVETIGDFAFSDCESLAEITIPDSVTSIGMAAFSSTAYFEDRSYWEIIYINNHLVRVKDEFESVTIKPGTKSIAANAFYNNRMLEAVTIPDSIVAIGDSAFAHCYDLKTVHYLGTSSDWDKIKKDSYYGIASTILHYCTKTEQVNETCTTDGKKASWHCDICNEHIAGGEKISKSHLVDTKYTVDKNPTCTTKGSKSYHCLREGCDYKTGATNISPTGHLNKSTLPFQESTCKEIGYTEGEFCNDCKTWISGHEIIDLSHTDTDGNNICDDCSEDMSKIVLFGACSEQGDMITYTLYTNGNLVISGSGEMTDYESEDLPWYEKKGSIKAVTIKENVKRIDEDSFRECYNLSKITVDKNNKYYSNDSFGVLFNKGKTELIQYPLGKNIKVYYVPDTVTTIGVAAFEGCKNIQGVMIPESVTTISSKAFYECRQLEDVIIPDGVRVIGYYAFALCDSFKNITVPENVKVMGDCAFSGCNSLETVTIHEGLTSIESYTFEHCFSLKSVSLPTTVEKIGYKAFNGCFNLKKIYYAGTEDDFFWDVIIDRENRYLEEAAISYSHKHGYSLFGTQKATCTLYGLKKYSCICGGIYATEIPATGHTEVVDEAVAPACTTTGLTEGKRCSVCGKVFVAQQKIEATGHKYSTSTTKAILNKNGSVETKCTVCGYVKNSTTIYSPKTFTLSTTKYVYDGKNKTPAVTVKDSAGKKLIKGTDYKLTVASKRSAIGRYTVKVTFMGNYSGTKNLYFYILPGKPATVKSAAQTSSAIKLTWSKVAGAAGYTVYRYSPSKKAYVKAGATTSTSYTVKNLLAGTKYTFRVVAYGKTSSGKVYNSESYALIKTATCTATPTVKLASTAKGRATVAWNNVSGETGYQVYYATSKNGTYSRIANYKANTAKIYKTGLKSGNTYYFKVRTYIKTDSGYVYSPFSAVKSVKIK